MDIITIEDCERKGVGLELTRSSKHLKQLLMHIHIINGEPVTSFKVLQRISMQEPGYKFNEKYDELPLAILAYNELTIDE